MQYMHMFVYTYVSVMKHNNTSQIFACRKKKRRRMIKIMIKILNIDIDKNFISSKAT